MVTNNRQREARRFEEELAADLCGRRVPFSGAGRVKADVRKPATYGINADGIPVRRDALTFRVEAKTTWRTTYAFRLAEWNDLLRAARQSGEHPIFAIRFLSARTDIAIAPAALMEEARVHTDLLAWLEMNKTRIIRADTVGKIVLNEIDSPEAWLRRLVVLPYPTFLEGIKNHELYRPIEEDEPADTP